jgi:microcystin-dependent protein
MSEPFMGEIKLTAFNFAPKGWALCNGQLLPINQNQALFSILGTTYGGNGQTTFALPDLRGRVPIYQGQGFTEGQAGGEEAHTLVKNELPQHNHPFQASSTNADAPDPTILAKSNNVYGASGNLTTLSPASIGSTGSQPHENMQPYLVISFCIALQGIFPSRN